MRITFLKKNPLVYSCNVYHIRGNWNAIDDVNTLVDVGTDNFILTELKEMMSTGVGKRRVEQVILTHEHFDHAGGLKFIRQEFKPIVYAFQLLNGVDIKLRDGMKLKMGDTEGVILHTPGHSQDSICIYCEQYKTLFSGDTLLNIRTPGGTYTASYVEALERIASLDITSIYSGHDEPITENVKEILNDTLKNVIKSKIIK
jgi:glyoxylase-like metal-dependent hydrolase (beta-lactamase superfamily II)